MPLTGTLCFTRPTYICGRGTHPQIRHESSVGWVKEQSDVPVIAPSPPTGTLRFTRPTYIFSGAAGLLHAGLQGLADDFLGGQVHGIDAAHHAASLNRLVAKPDQCAYGIFHRVGRCGSGIRRTRSNRP